MNCPNLQPKTRYLTFQHQGTSNVGQRLHPIAQAPELGQHFPTSSPISSSDQQGLARAATDFCRGKDSTCRGGCWNNHGIRDGRSRPPRPDLTISQPWISRPMCAPLRETCLPRRVGLKRPQRLRGVCDWARLLSGFVEPLLGVGFLMTRLLRSLRSVNSSGSGCYLARIRETPLLDHRGRERVLFLIGYRKPLFHVLVPGTAVVSVDLARKSTNAHGVCAWRKWDFGGLSS